MRFRWIAPLSAIILLLLTGCSSFLDQDQLRIDSAIGASLEPDHPVGQTFVARHAGLDGLEIWLEPSEGSQGVLCLHLRSEPQAKEDLVTAKLPLAMVTAPAFYRFSFSPLHDSHGHYYYAFLEIKGTGEVGVGAASGDAYLDGALYRDHEPLDAQAVFRLAYNPGWMAWDLVQASVKGLGLLMVAGLLYLVPGWALLILLWPERDSLPVRHGAEALGVAVGLSLALYALLLLWTDVVGVHLGSLNAWLPVALGLTALLCHYRPWQAQLRHTLASIRQWPMARTSWPDIALVLIVGLASVGRLLAVRGLEMPLWDDSVQHTVIVKRILESGGLFQSWEPYASYNTLSVHFGFHGNVAIWAWATGMDAPQAVLWAGQLLNLLAVLTLYPLAYRLKGAWGGVFTILVAGLLTRFPAYYANWGRYPQMCGQIILPVAAWWLWRLLNHEVKKRAAWILGGACLIAGMTLAYYRMVFHFLAFAIAAFIVGFTISGRARHRNWLAIVGLAVAVVVLAYPWLHNIGATHQIVPTFDKGTLHTSATRFWHKIKSVNIGWSAPMAAVVFLGTFISFAAGGKAALPVVWLWMLVALPVLRLANLPAVWIIQEFTINTSLYIPQALIWGVFVGHFVEKPVATTRWRTALLALILVAIGLWRLPSLVTMTDRGFDLSTHPDLRAAQWIDRSLPDDAFFLINGIIYTDGYSAVGGDAGWWIPALAGHKVLIPPQYALIAERPSEPGYSEAVNNLVSHLFENPPNTTQGREAICRFPREITHVYLGQRRGMVAKPIEPPPHPMLPAKLLLEDPAFRLIYHQDRVMIFEFDRGVCRSQE